MIKLKLQWWLETSDLLPSEAGYRSGRSCVDNLAMLSMSVEEAFSMGKDVLACFLDVSDILTKKLSVMGCPHNIVNLVSFLTHERNVMFIVSDSYTITRKVFKGLPQG